MRSSWMICISGGSRNLINSNSWAPCESRTRLKNHDPRFTPIEKMVTRRTEHNTEEEHFSTRDRLGEKLTLFFLQSEEKERERKIDGNHSWVLVVSTVIRLRMGKEAAKDKEVHHKSSDKDEIKRTSSDTDGKQTGTRPVTTDEPPRFKISQGECDKNKTCLYWYPLDCMYVFLQSEKIKAMTRRRQEENPSQSPHLFVWEEAPRREAGETPRNQFFKERPTRSRSKSATHRRKTQLKPT